MGERHLAPSFKHWNWFDSLSYTKHFGFPLPPWEPVSRHHSGSLTHTEKWTRTHHAVTSSPARLCISVSVHTNTILYLSQHVLFQVFLFLHFACNPLCLEQRGFWKCTLTICVDVNISFFFTPPPGMWFIHAWHGNTSKFLFSFSVKRNWVTWSILHLFKDLTFIFNSLNWVRSL